MTDLSAVPLVALSNNTKEIISTLLNPTKCLPSDDGLPRDWRGLAHLSGLCGEAIPFISSKPDPCGYILSMMQEKSQNFMLNELKDLFEQLDRWDVIDDTIALMEKDAECYTERSNKILTSANTIENDIDAQILTYDDSDRLRQGLGKQHYDAFLLFDDADINFADEVTENLEKKFNLKLCRKDRDFIVGLPFEHSATMQLISERCNRLVVIVSPDFLKSPANKFILNFAQALGIDKGQRKIIPCLYRKCQLPPQLSYYFTLDYNRVGKFWDFWGRLRDSVKTPGNSSCTERTDCEAKKPACTKNVPTEENKKCDTVPEVCEVKETYSKPCKMEETRQPCKMEASRQPCEIKEIRCHLPEERVLNEVENVQDMKSAQYSDKKDKGCMWNFTGKKYSLPKLKKNKRSLPGLKASESMPVLNSEQYVSTVSLSDSEKKKGNFVSKYVRKVKGLMKS